MIMLTVWQAGTCRLIPPVLLQLLLHLQLLMLVSAVESAGAFLGLVLERMVWTA